MSVVVSMPMNCLFLLVVFVGHPHFGLLEAFAEGYVVAVDSGRKLSSMSASSSRVVEGHVATIEDVLSSESTIALNYLSLWKFVNDRLIKCCVIQGNIFLEDSTMLCTIL